MTAPLDTIPESHSSNSNSDKILGEGDTSCVVFSEEK